MAERPTRNCDRCDDTGYRDYAGFGIDPCDHQDHPREEVIGEETTLGDLEPGLFQFGDTIGFKSEYRTQNSKGFYQSDAYCVESGEYFWGGAKSSEDRERLVVRSLSIAAMNPKPAEPTCRTEQWRDIASAPKEGWAAPILTCRMGEFLHHFGGQPVGEYAEPPEAAYWNEHGDCWTPCQRPHDGWEPTHWMPMLAAPGTEKAVEPVAITIAQRWAPVRSEIESEKPSCIPPWAHHLCIGSYREQGWTAFDQNRNGKPIATGNWGEEIYLLSDGSIACTGNPHGSALPEKQNA